MDNEVPQISNISASEEKVCENSLQNENISDNVGEGKVLEAVSQSGNSYDVKSCLSETENVELGIEKVEDVHVHISSPEDNSHQHEMHNATIKEIESAEGDNTEITRENIDENISLPMDQEGENIISLPFSDISAEKSIPFVDPAAGKEQSPSPKPRKPAHQYCFQATSNEGFSDISSVSSD